MKRRAKDGRGNTGKVKGKGVEKRKNEKERKIKVRKTKKEKKIKERARKGNKKEFN